jgi:hypothetical protein
MSVAIAGSDFWTQRHVAPDAYAERLMANIPDEDASEL